MSTATAILQVRQPSDLFALDACIEHLNNQHIAAMLTYQDIATREQKIECHVRIDLTTLRGFIDLAMAFTDSITLIVCFGTVTFVHDYGDDELPGRDDYLGVNDI